MANPQLNIGNLDFDDIKQSLKSYLSTQDTFKDYDFEGSALSTLLDVLSYNTMYYAFYSNMIANEMFLDTAQKLSSVISLAKPLGYVVPGARSATARFQVVAGGELIPISKYSLFVGKDETGRSFNFYTIEDHTTDNSGFAEFQIYEGSKLFRNVEVTLDEDKTKAFIGRTDIDIRSLTVEVDGEEWLLSSNTNELITSESKVYFLDRTDAGFYIVFGGNYSDDINTGAGQPIPENSIVRVSYLTSSGEIGNGVGNFTTSVITGDNILFRTVFPSSGGALEPNLDAVKFFAPKWFSAQERVVTKNDALALLSREFISEESPDANLRISVWGGEENDPPYYGRLFVSLLNEDPNGEETPNGADIVNALQVLKDKCVVTVLPEYIGPIQVDMTFRMNGTSNRSVTNKSLSQLQSEVQSALYDYFGTVRKFNLAVKQSELQSIAESVDPSLTFDSSEITDTVTKEFTASLGKRYFYLKNPIKRSVSSIPTRSIQTTPTSGYNGINNLQLVDFPQSTDSSGWAPLYLVTKSSNNVYTYVTENGTNVNAGRVNYNRGIVEINAGYLTQAFTMTIAPKNISFTSKQELVTIPKFDVTITAE
jgi:hypothetical protein